MANIVKRQLKIANEMEDKFYYHLNSVFSELKALISEEISFSVREALLHSNIEKSNRHDEILTVDEVVKEFKISKSHLNNLRNRYEDFPVIAIDKAIRFDRSELKAFFNKISCEQNKVR